MLLINQYDDLIGESLGALSLIGLGGGLGVQLLGLGWETSDLAAFFILSLESSELSELELRGRFSPDFECSI